MTSPVIVVSAPGRTPLHLVVVDVVEVGRSCPGLLLDDPAVSRRHLEIRPGDGPDQIIVRDLGSANGTSLDDRPIEGSTPVGPGQVIQLGDVTIRLADDGIAVGAGAAAGALSPVDPGPMTSIERVADVVVRNTAEAASSGEVRKGLTRTIVFSDIEGSTDLAVSLGDVPWFELLEVHNRLLRSCLDRHDGTEVKSQGDGFMLTFPSARRAVGYMVDMQRALAADPQMQAHGLKVRVGAHTGEAIEADDGDLFGQAVIAAARVGAIAVGGEILVSSIVREIVESWEEVTFGESRLVTLKGLAKEWAVHPVEWRE